MDYSKHYALLITRAVSRVTHGYTERHHILPKCLGGSNEKDNLVDLYPEEHFVAHQLLVKMYPRVRGIVYAAMVMCGNPYGKRSNKAYGWLRRAAAIVTSEFMIELFKNEDHRKRHIAAVHGFCHTPEYKAKISKIHTGRVKSEQERKNIAEAGRRRAPRTFSDEAKKSFSAAQKLKWALFKETGKNLEIAQKAKETRLANGGYVVSEEQRRKISESQRGRVIPPEQRSKISAALKGRKKTPEHIEKIAAANRKPKVPPTAEEIAAKAAIKFANLSARSKGKKLGASHKGNISSGLSDAYSSGRRKPHMAKLTDDQVREIRNRVLDASTTQKQLAQEYGVNASAISDIKNGRSYRHVK